MFKPNLPYTVPFHILSLTKTFINGVNQQSYVENNTLYFCSAKSYGGTEKIINNVLAIEDTLVLETHFIPNLKPKDRIKFLNDNTVYEILVTPENIDRRNHHLRFKVVRLRG